jgi:hypothetical protein
MEIDAIPLPQVNCDELLPLFVKRSFPGITLANLTR